MGWGNKFELFEWAKKDVLKTISLNLGSGDQSIFTKVGIDENDNVKFEVVPPEEIYVNRPPTHDPYANPNAHIYYECNCGAILDPRTKSFAALNNYASEKGWKIRFGLDGYTPHCVKCGEGVE